MWLSALQTTLTLFAAALVAFALFWDRPGWRGRPALRCRKCWFDLTGAKDVAHASRDAPVTCPECGREHRSLRSMMRTRRRKRFIAAAAVILVVMYSILVAPAVRARGWIAGVPGVCLVAMVPFFSEAEGSSDRYLPELPFFSAHTAPAGSGGEVILDEMVARLRDKIPGSTLGWPSRRLLFLLGRLESAQILTDPLTLKGTAYRECVTAWRDAGLVLKFESAWARRQVHVSVSPDLPAYDAGLVCGHVRARTLSGEEAWLWNSLHARFLIEKRRPLAVSGGFAPYSGPLLTPAEARERLRFDFTRRVDAEGRPLPEETPRDPSPLGHIRSETDGQYTVTFTASMTWNESDRFQWRGPESNDISVVSTIPAEQVRALPPVSRSRQVESWIRARIEPEFFLEYDSVSERFRPAFRFARRDSVDKTVKEGVFFVGSVEIAAVEADASNGPARPIAELKGWKHCWLVEATRDPESIEDWQSPMVRTGISVDRSSTWLEPSYGLDPSTNESTRLVVRVRNSTLVSTASPDLQGLFGGDTIFDGTFEIPIPNWTPTEFRRFITSGYLPDHALDGS